MEIDDGDVQNIVKKLKKIKRGTIVQNKLVDDILKILSPTYYLHVVRENNDHEPFVIASSNNKEDLQKIVQVWWPHSMDIVNYYITNSYDEE